MVLFSALLISCTGPHHEAEAAQIPASSTAVPLASGAEIAQALTARYLNTPANCGTATTPSFLCSGIIYRGTSHSTSYDAWNPSPDSQRSGGVSFSYLRKDANTSRIIGGNKKGFIFYPVLQMPTDKVKAAILCAYVIDAGTNARSDSGCGESPNLPASAPCETQGISTAAQWLAHYQANGSSLNSQCGFGVRSALNAVAVTGFNAMLGAHALNIAQSFTKNIEMRLATWPQDTPKTVPIQAFFYVNDGLADAQYDQRQFFYKSGIYVPIIFITLPATATGTATFEYKESDQTWGQGVAAELTRRYNDTRVNCGSDSKPAFLCSGIDLRGTSGRPEYDTWNPSPTAERVGGISFSYLRRDYKIKRLAFNYTHGFIFYPILNKPADKIKIEVLCFFPIDGTSDRRPEGGCGAYPNRPMSDRCDRVGVTTGEQWAAHYNQYGEYPGGYGGCSMDVRDSASNLAGQRFYQGIIGGQLISPKPFDKPNDLKHQVWAQNIPATLPIEAFFYVVPEGLSAAQIDQQKFYERTHGLVVPIIHLTLPSTPADDATFEYNAIDQVVAPIARPKPAVPKTYNAEGDHLRISDIYNDDHLDVEIPHYTGMGALHTLRVRWNGRVRYNSPIIEVGDPPGKRTIAIPRVEVIDNIGRSVEVGYSVKETPTSETLESQKLILHIDPQELTLPAPNYSASKVTVDYGGQTGYSVRVRWIGVITHDTAAQKVTAGQPNVFPIDAAWVDENRGKTVLINYTVARTGSGDPWMFSQVLRVTL